MSEWSSNIRLIWNLIIVRIANPSGSQDKFTVLHSEISYQLEVWTVTHWQRWFKCMGTFQNNTVFWSLLLLQKKEQNPGLFRIMQFVLYPYWTLTEKTTKIRELFRIMLFFIALCVLQKKEQNPGTFPNHVSFDRLLTPAEERTKSRNFSE